MSLVKQEKGYEYIKRKDSPYLEISEDAESNKFHVTQIMSACTGYLFPPYRGAGLADLASFLTHGERSTHLEKNHTILGFYFNVISPMRERLGDFKKAWPELTEYAIKIGKEFISGVRKLKNEEHVLFFIQEAEEKFGKEISVSKSGNLNPLKSFL